MSTPAYMSPFGVDIDLVAGTYHDTEKQTHTGITTASTKGIGA